MATPRKIVITGVSRGLGRAMVEGFAQKGHQIIGCSRSMSAIEALQESLPNPHRFDCVDVSDWKAVSSWAQSVLQEGDLPDLLINNAAIINPNAPLWEMPVEAVGELFQINLMGTFHVCRAFLPAMVSRGEGTIVNFSSGWGRSTSPEVAPYCASKYAIEGMTKALAQELPAGMAAIPLNPGVIHTDMLQSAFGEGASAYPKAESWAKQAVPLILSFGPRDSGRSLSVS
ncbi:Short-chain alcohol dehydrogenase [Planctomycetales bacterium 10988]|nr:Short-chain alcohol dehydrogenase [Planctomycetales bacterium 10988]